MLYISAFLFAVTLIAIGCKPDKDFSDSSIIDQADQIGFYTIDTLTIQAKTIDAERIRTDKRVRALLGSYVDPTFGLVEAGFVTQLDISTEEDKFLKLDSNYVIDSVYLVLNFDNSLFYGDSNFVLKCQVHELETELISDETGDIEYYSDESFTKGELLGEKLSKLNFKGRTINNEEFKESIVIRLNDSFGQRLLDKNDIIFESSTELQKELSGIYVSTEPATNLNEGVIAILNLTNVQSSVYLHYHSPISEIRRTSRLAITTNSQSVNLFNLNHSGTKVESVFDDFNAGKKLLYLQSMGGTNIEFLFPHLKSLTKLGKIAVNQAILEVTLKEDSLLPHLGISIRQKKDDGTFISTIDETVDGVAGVGGSLNEEVQKYEFNITRQINYMFNEIDEGNDEPITMALIPSLAGSTPYRTILFGTDTTEENSVKLTLTITTN